MMQTAVATLEMARFARGIGDADGCLSLSEAAVRQACYDHDFDTAFLAACVPARMYLRRCEPELAVAHYRHALDLALTHRLEVRVGEVHHDLYVAARDARSEAGARRYYGAAAESYLERRDARIAGLLADRAEGVFTAAPSADTASAAMERWRALPFSVPGAIARFFAGCNLVVAAAWLGWESRHSDGLSMLEAAFVELPSHEGAAAGLCDAAGGALRAGDFPTGAEIADRAVRIAGGRAETIVEGRAREVLAAALAERAKAAYD